jgi:hypothetical protein
MVTREWSYCAAVGVLILGLLGVTAPHSMAANIAWFSFHPADNTPSNAAATAGATTAPDKGYTDMLAAAGHTVTRFVSTATPNAASLNNDFDLVIISRSAPSTDFEPGADSANWSAITTPVMFLHGYALRNNRLGFTTGATIPDTAGPIRLNVTNPTHPIFAGIALDGTNATVNNYSTGLQTFNSITMAGISVNTNPITAGGTILGTVNRAGDPANNGMIIGEFPAGTGMSNGTSDAVAGQRLVFLTGSREAGGISAEVTGLYDLTPDGELMFRNAVNYLTNLPAPVLPKLIVNTVTGAVAIQNTLAEPITFDYYEITSAGGRLTTSGWNSLSDQNLDAGRPTDFNNNGSVNGGDLTTWRGAYGVNNNGDADGDGDSDGNDFLAWQRELGMPPGEGDSWDEVGGVSSNLLAEAFLNGSTTIAPGAKVMLGNAFVTGAAGDLSFRLARQGGTLSLGAVEYVTTGPSAAVPEPASGIVAVVAGLAGVAQVRRRRTN